MKKLNIAYGENLINCLDNEDFDTAVLDILSNNGNIVEYSPNLDSIEELFQHIRGSYNFREITPHELNEVNKRLTLNK